MTKSIPKIIALVMLCVSTTAVAEDTHTVLQKDKSFSAESLTIKVGDKVSFANEDEYFHNVFSLSDTKSFDLGSFAAGEERTVTFDAEGEVEVECAIHPSMFITIKVEK
ncbi:MAG: plastocyanin/azurin family copper-binding protein [Gammaproteobacteria bacterium]